MVFERMTDAAREAVAQAVDEADALGHDYLGSEHLLIGLVHVRGEASAPVLDPLEPTAPQISADVGEYVGRGEQPTGQKAYTPRALKVLKGAGREAGERGHQRVTTLHLLAALLRTDGVAVRVLDRLGVDRHEFASRTAKRLDELQLTEAIEALEPPRFVTDQPVATAAWPGPGAMALAAAVIIGAAVWLLAAGAGLPVVVTVAALGVALAALGWSRRRAGWTSYAPLEDDRS